MKQKQLVRRSFPHPCLLQEVNPEFRGHDMLQSEIAEPPKVTRFGFMAGITAQRETSPRQVNYYIG
jgi:hypothetical protein